MSGGSGNDNLLNMGLMIAAGIAAPALAPMLMTGGAAGLGLGATAATAATGATLGGLAGAVTGKDPLQSALMGGLGGAASGYFGGVSAAEPGSMLASGPTASNAGLSSMPTPAMYPTPQSTFTPPNFEYLPSGEMTVSSNPIANLPSTTGPSQDVLKSMAQQADASRIASQPQLFGMPKAEAIGGGIAGINEILSAKPTSAYIPPDSKYKGGSLANFRYDPDRYTPADVPPLPYSYREMAMGGLAMGGMPPQTNFANPAAADIGTSQYSMATDPFSGNIAQRMAKGGIADLSGRIKNLGEYQKTNSNANLADMVSILGGKPYTNPNQSTFDPNTYQASTVTKPYLEREQYAKGGIASLGMYSDGGRLLRGPGDGVSDNIPARIGQRQEARLADGEFVVPARIVSELGNGSTEAGAKRLYKMMDNVQSSRKKSIGKGKFAQNTKAYKHLPA